VVGTYDAEYMARFYDAYGDKEWHRHERPSGRVALAVHCGFLDEFVRAGDLVLGAGAGPGRSTIELARRGARAHVGDLSPGQLDLNRRHVGEAGHEQAVVAREVLDICDLFHLDTGTFDAVTCFGGPLSYVRDRADDALAELARVTRPGGHVLLSVMSTLGAMRAFLPFVIAEGRTHGPDHTEHVFTTGELDRDTNTGHEMRMYRWSELAALCARHGDVVAAAAANHLAATPDPDTLDTLTDDEWRQLLSLELRLTREPGVLDAGTHIVAALQVT
jgi:SAM-dependent methyltransferase